MKKWQLSLGGKLHLHSSPKQSHLLNVAQVFSEVSLSAWASFIDGSLKLKPKGVHWGATMLNLSTICGEPSTDMVTPLSGRLKAILVALAIISLMNYYYVLLRLLWCYWWSSFLVCHLENSRLAYSRHHSLRELWKLIAALNQTHTACDCQFYCLHNLSSV